MQSLRRPTYVAAILVLASSTSALALAVTQTNNADALSNELFLNFGGLNITNSTVSGNALQFGTWTNASGTYGLPTTGIVLSSGNVNDYGDGVNSDSGNSSDFSGFATASQEALLDPITGGGFDHRDTAQLTIEFDAPSAIDNVTFFATFGSEEFPEYVGSTFIDGFGLYVNGVNQANAVGQPINIDHPDMVATSGTELDGVLAPGGNPVLQFDVPIAAGANVFDIIISDTSDGILDSTVYLSSFFGSGEVDPGDPGLPSGQTEFDPLLPDVPADPETGEFLITLPDLEAGVPIWVDPPVSVGFEYSVTGGAAITQIGAPSLATVPDLTGYLVTDGITTVAMSAGQTLDLELEFGSALSSFTLLGIDQSLMLDPADPLAFPLQITFDQFVSAANIFSVTPITEEVFPAPAVPLPGGLGLYIGALAGAGLLRARRRSRA